MYWILITRLILLKKIKNLDIRNYILKSQSFLLMRFFIKKLKLLNLSTLHMTKYKLSLFYNMNIFLKIARFQWFFYYYLLFFYDILEWKIM